MYEYRDGDRIGTGRHDAGDGTSRSPVRGVRIYDRVKVPVLGVSGRVTNKDDLRVDFHW